MTIRNKNSGSVNRSGRLNPDTGVKPILKVENVTKNYPGTTALNKVSYNVYPGKVNVLLGENGAGKSTLMKIIAGAEQPSSGRLLMADREIELLSPSDALKYGIGIVHQELTLCPNLSVAENIFLAREIKTIWGTVNFDRQEEIAASVLKKLNQSIHPQLPVDSLRVGQQQLIEIARTLKDDVKILIMDEPTSALSQKETSILLEIIRELTTQDVAVIYISHRLDESMEIGDYFAILRDGHLVAESDRENVTLPWIIKCMSGRDPDELFPETNHQQGSKILEIRDLTLTRPEGEGYMLDQVSLTFYTGEITGIFGLMGAGRTELLETIFGLYPSAKGEIFMDGKAVTGKNIQKRIRAGLMLIPEDRQRQGLVQSMSVAENMTLASLYDYLNRFFLSSEKEQNAVQDHIKKLLIKLANADQPILSLSGGNQQKVVIAKSLLAKPKVLMMDEPTRGVDVGAKFDIFKIMSDIAASGACVLFTSSELKEVMEVADRVLVMAKGRVTADLRKPGLTEGAILEACVIKNNEN